MLTRTQLEQAESLLEQLDKEAEESERAIEALRKRRQLAEDRLGAETAKAPELASTDTKNAIKDKRDQVQEQLDKPLSENACDKAEQGLKALEGLVAEAKKEIEEKQRAVELAQKIQDLSREALNALVKVAAPKGHRKLDKKTFPGRLKDAAAYASVKPFEPVISALVSGKSQPERAKIQDLLDKAEDIKKAIAAAGDEVLTELKDRAEQVQDQHDLVDGQMRKNAEMLEKLQSPSLLVTTLLKSWPKDVTRPKDLTQKLMALVDTDALEKTRETIEGLGETEMNKTPWTDADWLGAVMPSAKGYYADLREALKDMNVAAQQVVVDALDEAMVEKRKAETESKEAVTAAVKGGDNRKQLAGELQEPGKTIYKKVEQAREKNSKMNISDQLELVASEFLARDTTLQEQQQALKQDAKKAGVQIAEPDPTKYGGKQYAELGTHGKATVYARLDDCPTGSGMGAFINLYKTALTKGIIPSSSTGSEGVKYEGHLGGWVVKVTRRAVAHNPGFDNVWSPYAADNTDSVAQVDEPPAIYLNFDAWTDRH